jgi:cysteinyl-tRNA synthetase
MFEYNGYEVKQIINVTDIGHLSSDNDDGEDKMTQALKREGKPMSLEAMREVADYYFEEFKKDIEKLNIESPYKFPFASDHIKEDIDLIEKLNKAEYTYAISDGIYFDVSKFPEYGKLGNIKFDSNEEQSRIGMNPEKKNQRDFAVWKFNKDIGFDAPFGKGFPGWHIECSAMSVKYLGSKFDIHTGGIDHIPVHHNNEIAQAKCAGYEYAKYWMHNAHLNITTENGSEKMAKSGGNFITLKTLEEKNIDPLALRYIFLSARYSSPLQFSWEALEGAETAIKRIKDKLGAFPDNGSIVQTEFNSYINDDLDTPKVLALISDVLKDETISDADKKATILDFDRVLGLSLSKKIEFVVPEEVKKLVEERDEARSNKDFAKSDELRDKIQSLGYIVSDTPEGTTVYPK